ncbi:hypothetical protein GAO09_01420 [Rhizobiales bacterium RZME27]|uniref:Uncharacterized protein n=1 Tax=Endobacterium cereale TaxID=2663029 RepID=A0A6A8A212_9HYPH|nr:hypothetical protein [Endobacterium cereale]MEB2844816.1 hypothetical protein [Endobacterium cereale]MQY44733.1 hypothetical protein [Endobacterium cereale]
MLTEDEAIAGIERLTSALEQRSLETRSIRQFFNVGEWLLAFEGLEACATYFTDAERNELAALKDYFGAPA